MTPSGDLLACERIGFQHVLGRIEEAVKVDCVEIADKYNRYYEAISKQCEHCYQADFALTVYFNSILKVVFLSVKLLWMRTNIKNI